MPPSDPSPSQELKYPPVRVNHSLTKLDLDTLMMRSTTRRQPEEAGSSLDESTYELLGDSLLETSDDEAHTESIASTNGPTPDDTSDFSDDDNDYGAVNRSTHDSIDASAGAAAEQQFDMHAVMSGEDSTLTEGPAHMEASESWKISLDEEPTEDSGVILGRKVLKSFADHAGDLPQVLCQYGCAQVRLVVHAALSQRSVPTPDSYKILYIGMPEQWLEDIITSQIGAALTASPSVSKSVMVRGQIEPYGPVIHVYRCAKFHAIADREKSSHVLVILDDGQQLKFGPGQNFHSSERPDLVVFCHPTIFTTAADVQDFTFASEMFEGENIPCIDLVQARPYGGGVPTYDSKSLRVCVEGRNDADTDYELKEVLPLDPYTFSQLEPMQLNRHLALISPHLLSAQAAKDSKMAQGPWINKSVKRFNDTWQPLKMLLTVMVFCALVPALFRGAAYAPLLFQKSTLSATQSSVSSQVPALASTVTPAVLTSQPVICNTHIPSVRSAARDLTLVPPQAKPPKRRLEKKDKKVPGFNIQATGDHQFVLAPSKELANSRRKPQVQIQISRNSQTVPARYNQTTNGEYVVDLEQKYAFGNFNVSIATLSKPFLQQYFEITLGHNKSILAQLLENTKMSFINTQDNLWNVSSTAVHCMRAGLATLEATTLLWTDDVRGSSEEVTAHLQNAMHAVQRRVDAGTQLLKEAPGAAWKGVRQATAPVRTSSPMLKARMNALRLRCKMEMAVGISSDSMEEKQSWACSKVRVEA